MRNSKLVCWIRDLNHALPGLLLGILLFGVFVQILGIFFITELANFSIGLWIGVLTAFFMAFHMAFTLNSAVDKGAKQAQQIATRNNLIRYFVVVVILGILVFTKVGNPLAAFVGVMGLKVSAYLQPVFGKCLRKKNQDSYDN